MYNRSRKTKVDDKSGHYAVIAGFCVICLLAIFFTLYNPKQKFAEMQIIDESQILVHNGRGHQFTHGPNKMFEQKTLSDAKSLFMSALTDTNQISACKSSSDVEGVSKDEEEQIEIPDNYDWREAYPQCVQPVMDIGADRNCSASYAFTTLSATEDRICMATNQTVKLSSQELIDCDVNTLGCEGGYANKVLNWGKKKGFITEDCMEYTGTKNECQVDHLESNECRVNNEMYRVTDYCFAFNPQNIQREIKKNGPVVG